MEVDSAQQTTGTARIGLLAISAFLLLSFLILPSFISPHPVRHDTHFASVSYNYGFAQAALTQCGFSEGQNWPQLELLVPRAPEGGVSSDVASGFRAFQQGVDDQGIAWACSDAATAIGPQGDGFIASY